MKMIKYYMGVLLMEINHVGLDTIALMITLI